MKTRLRSLFAIAFAAAASVVSAQAIPIAQVKHTGPVDFEREILPIFRRNCLACHSATEAQGDLVMETPQAILKGGGEGPAVIPGKGAESLLVKLAARQKEPHMPPADNDSKAKPLTSEELGLIRLWIDEGAKGEVRSVATEIAWQPLPPGLQPIYAVAVTEDGQYAAAARANQVFLYLLPGQRELGRLSDTKLIERGLYKKPGAADVDLIQSLAFSPDGTLLASGGFRTVKLWRRTPPTRKLELNGLETAVTAIGVSRDGKLAAVGEKNGTIKVFDLADGRVTSKLEGHAGGVRGISFTKDGALVVSCSTDKTFKVWNVAGGKLLASVETPTALNAVAWVAADSQIATVGGDNFIRLWDRLESAPRQAPQPSKALATAGPMTWLQAIADGAQLAVGAPNQPAHVWDVAIGKVTKQLATGGPAEAVAVSPDGRMVAAVGGADVRLVDNTSGQVRTTQKGDFRAALAVGAATRAAERARRNIEWAQADLDAAIANQKIEAEAEKKAIEEYKKATDFFRKNSEAAKGLSQEKAAAEKPPAEEPPAEEPPAEEPPQKQEAEDEQKRAAVAAAESLMNAAKIVMERSAEAVKKAQEAIVECEKAVKDTEDAATIVEAQRAEATRASAATEKPFRAVTFAPNGASFAAIGESGSVHTYDGETGAPVGVFGGGDAAAALATFVTDGTLLVAGGKSVALWDVAAEWKLERVIGSPDTADAFADRVTALDFSPDGKRLATGGGVPSRSGEIKIWDVASGTMQVSFKDPHGDVVTSLDFSPDGTHVASSAADRLVKVFQASDGQYVRSFEGHTQHVLSVAWGTDDRTLVSSGMDNVVKIWDVRTGEQRRSVSGFAKEVASVRFVGESENIVVATGDKQVRVLSTMSGASVRDYTGMTDYCFSAAASADGKMVVAGGADGVFRLWNDQGVEVAAFAPPK